MRSNHPDVSMTWKTGSVDPQLGFAKTQFEAHVLPTQSFTVNHGIGHAISVD